MNSMEKSLKEYTRWSAQKLPPDLAAELAELRGDEKKIYDRFCKDLSFGTSGMRGRMGAGTNRINSVTLRRAAKGIAAWLLDRFDRPKLLIAYDTRINSREYAVGMGELIAGRGVGVYILGEAAPVPLLSYAVRAMGLSAGIMITASHNPKEYNGCKVYDEHGNQINDKQAAELEQYISKIDMFEAEADTQKRTTEPPVLRSVEAGLKQSYLAAVTASIPRFGTAQATREALSEVKICYTALNGTGNSYVPELLRGLGMPSENIAEVEVQNKRSGSFQTCPYPNPERTEVFDEAIRCCRAQQEKPQLILATDPDSDRLGVMCLSSESGEEAYLKLSGNQVGELLFDYICECRSQEDKGAAEQRPQIAFKSFVSSPLTEKIAAAHGIQLRNVFTGFKNIAHGMQRLEESGEGEFVFGFEESLGYLCGDYTRDKDAILAAGLVCMAAARLAGRGKTLTDRLEEIYQGYGYQSEAPFEIEYEDERDRKKANRIMDELFAGKLKRCTEQRYTIKKEYCCRQQQMYSAETQEGHRLIVRPSGTEPKLKIYIFANGQSREAAAANAEALRRQTERLLRDC